MDLVFELSPEKRRLKKQKQNKKQFQKCKIIETPIANKIQFVIRENYGINPYHSLSDKLHINGVHLKLKPFNVCD